MSRHTWKFFRAGGVDQVSLESASDLLSLDQLDQKLWVALSCPTSGLEFDTKTLQLIDADKDGRIRAPDIIEAFKWAGANLKDPEILLRPATSLPLSAINDSTEEGKRLLSSAQQILRSLGKDLTAVTVEDTADTTRIFSATSFNGDGIIPPAAASDPFVQQVLTDIMTCCGGEPDRTGAPGVSQPKADLFFTEAEAFNQWHRKAEEAGVLALGANTAAAMAALDAVRAKIEDYFVRCRTAAFDPRAVPALNRLEAEYQLLAPKDLSATPPELLGFPLSHIEPSKALPLRDNLNPAWSAAIAKFAAEVVHPLLGEKSELTEADWNNVVERFTSYRAWQSSKAGAIAEKLGIPRIQEILASNARAQITDLIAKDKALEPEMNAIANVDRLVRYQRDLFRLANNFVSFSEFYTARGHAIFQAGRLYLDARSCDLCIKVADVAKHALLATLSRIYLTYCECTRRGGTDKMLIAAAFTGGDSDNLMVGRNGIFYDRAGGDWDATIVRIIEHPISIRQAIFAPYKRFAKMVGEQIEKLAASRDKALTDRAATTLTDSTKTLGTPPAPAKPGDPAAPPNFDAAKFAGIFAAIGLAVGALGTAIASIATGFLRLTWWQMPLAVLGVLLAVSGPSAVMAYLKLRQRNLGPLLDGCGWAVNGRMKINIPFGAALTCIAAIPHNAKRLLNDPFPEKHRGRIWTLIILLLGILAAVYYFWPLL